MIDGKAVFNNGFFSGYTIWTWYAIILQSFGGLLVSFVVKYADSIIKVLATTIAFLVSTIASTFIFGFVVGTQFIIGSFIVLTGKIVSLSFNHTLFSSHLQRLSYTFSVYPLFS
jgi:UDP-sugar transporter A1/2/3